MVEPRVQARVCVEAVQFAARKDKHPTQHSRGAVATQQENLHPLSAIAQHDHGGRRDRWGDNFD